jgi:hypothetical protein
MLVPGAAGPAGPVSRAAEAVQADPRTMEMMFWQSASAGDDVGQLRAYLAKYPNGSFVDLAKAKIASLEKSASVGGAQRNVPAAKLDPRAMELAFWNSVSNSNDIAQLTAYIDQYPSGQFVRAARAKIATLTRPGAPTATATSSALASSGGRTVGGGVGFTPTPTPTGANLSGNSLPAAAAQAPASGLPRPHGRYGDSDDYVCNHGDPGDSRTVQACQRLRGTAAPD